MRPACGMCASSSTHGWGNHQQVNTTLSSAPNCMEGVKQVSKQTISIWDPAQHAAQPQAVSMTCTVVGTAVWWGRSTMTMTCTVVGWLLHPLGKMEPEAPMHSLQSVNLSLVILHVVCQQCAPACSSDASIGAPSSTLYLDHHMHRAALPFHHVNTVQPRTCNNWKPCRYNSHHGP